MHNFRKMLLLLSVFSMLVFSNQIVCCNHQITRKDISSRGLGFFALGVGVVGNAMLGAVQKIWSKRSGHNDNTTFLFLKNREIVKKYLLVGQVFFVCLDVLGGCLVAMNIVAMNKNKTLKNKKEKIKEAVCTQQIQKHLF